MSGHSKWATTKHQKAVKDSRRAKMFAKYIKNIEVATRMGGPDTAGNPTLFDAVAKAKQNSVPADNIARAIKRGSGEAADGVSYEAITYEGYGPSGVALYVECLTDNRNRAASDIRIAMTRNNGRVAEPGSVAYLFARKGQILVAKTNDLTEDDVLMAVLDAGADDVTDGGEQFVVMADPAEARAVRDAATGAGLTVDEFDIAWVPSTRTHLELEDARKFLKLVDALEDCDDVQDVWTNADISDEVLEALDA